MPTPITEADTKAAIAAAVEAATAGLREELATFRASQEAAAVDERIATAVSEATEPLTTQVAALQADLDAATLAAAAEKTRADAAESATTEAARLVEVASRRDGRLAEVAAAAPGFDKAYLEANAERWAGMDEAEFASRIEEYKAASTGITAGARNNGPLPTTTALTAAVIDRGAVRTGTGPSALKELSALQRQGFDARRI